MAARATLWGNEGGRKLEQKNLENGDAILPVPSSIVNDTRALQKRGGGGDSAQARKLVRKGPGSRGTNSGDWGTAKGSRAAPGPCQPNREALIDGNTRSEVGLGQTRKKRPE